MIYSLHRNAKNLMGGGGFKLSTALYIEYIGVIVCMNRVYYNYIETFFLYSTADFTLECIISPQHCRTLDTCSIYVYIEI